MDALPLREKTVLVTGAARRIGRALAIACARAGADVFIHYGKSEGGASDTQQQIISMGRRAWTLQADLDQPAEAAELVPNANKFSELYALINSAAVFSPLTLETTDLAEWQHHLAINLTAPFLLSQAFARQISPGREGRLINILDWRALRLGADHFPYTVSKAALAGMTRSLAVALAPKIAVNALALGAILPPSDRPAAPEIVDRVPAQRWGALGEVEDALIFLLSGPAYITGEIIHVDGGRHLV